MKKPEKIVVYLKTHCGWSEGVRAMMKKYDLEYEERDVIKNPEYYQEIQERTGQTLCPCVEIDGHMLADVSGEEVEEWMIKENYLEKSSAASEAPMNQGCMH